MPHPSKLASHSAKPDCQKDMSSTKDSNGNNETRENGVASASDGPALSLDNQSNDNQNKDPTSRHKGSGGFESKAASNESSFQPCLICRLNGLVLSSFGKYDKAGAGATCPNENPASKEDQEEASFDLVERTEVVKAMEDDQDDQMVMIDELDDEMLQW